MSAEKPNELIHRIYHILGGLVFPVFYWLVLSKKIVLIIFLIIAVIFSLIEILRFFFGSAQKFLYQKFSKLSILFKKEEAVRISGTTYMIWGVLLTTLFFAKDIAILAMIFLAIGDPIATWIGKKGKINFLGRNLEGFFAAFFVSFLIGFGLRYFSLIFLDYPIILWGAFVSSFIGHISLPVLKINDNLTIPIVTALLMQFV